MDGLVISILAQNKTEINKQKARLAACFQTVDKALLLQGFAIVGTAFLI